MIIIIIIDRVCTPHLFYGSIYKNAFAIDKNSRESIVRWPLKPISYRQLWFLVTAVAAVAMGMAMASSFIVVITSQNHSVDKTYLMHGRMVFLQFNGHCTWDVIHFYGYCFSTKPHTAAAATDSIQKASFILHKLYQLKCTLSLLLRWWSSLAGRLDTVWEMHVQSILQRVCACFKRSET